MTIISENIIDTLLDSYADEKNYFSDLKTMAVEQPDLVAFIDQENYTLLTNEEQALMEYLTTVIYFSAKSVLGKNLIVRGKELEKAEEANWNIFNEAATKNFSKILDIFFENYRQEDLLAMVEDSIQQDDENFVTMVGREIIFVACKSIIDTVDGCN